MQFGVASRGSRGGFSLVELLIVIAIVIPLLAILLPTLSSMQSDRRQAVCANNLRNLGLGLAAASRAGEPLDSKNWSDAILPFIGEEADLLYCLEHGTSAISYGMNNHAHRFGDEDAHRIALLDYKATEADVVVRDIAEQDSWSPTDGRYAARHTNQINVLLHSGSVQPRSPQSIDPRVTETWLGNWRPHRDDFVIGGAVEKTPSSSLVAANSEYDAGPGLAAANSTDPSEYPPLDPDNYCKYESFIDLDDNEGAAGDAVFFTVYDDPETNDHTIIELVEIFGQVVEFPRISPKPFASTVNPAAVGASQSQAWGHQTTDTKAVYEFSGLEPGKYKVWAYWAEHPNNSAVTPHTVFDGSLTEGGVQVHTETINQELSPSASTAVRKIYLNGINLPCRQIGTAHQIDSGTLRLEITADTGAIHPNEEEPGNDPAHVYQASQSLAVADAVVISCATDPNYEHGRCANEPPQELDNGEAEVTLTAGWSEQVDADSHGGSHGEVAAGDGSEIATYAFPDTVSGAYRIWMRWNPGETLASDVPVSIYEDDVLLRTVTVDQTFDYYGADLDDNGERWHSIGDVDALYGALSVVVSNGASSGTVIADGVRVQCAYGGPGDCDNSVYGRHCRRNDIPDEAMSEESEEAVQNGLGWLAKHQLPDGSWNYDHHLGTGDYVLDTPDVCGGRCSAVGSESDLPIASTGMALLPFLASGIGPSHEVYGEAVTQGIEYLLQNGSDGQPVTTGGGWLVSEGGIAPTHGGIVAEGYERGIAGLALLEALGVCRQSGFGSIDEGDLALAANLIASRVVRCQSQGTGGWRYWCAGGDDVTVSAWNVKALLAAQAVGVDLEALSPDTDVLLLARDYLDGLGVGPVVADETYGDYTTDYRYRWGEYWMGGRHYVSYMHAVLGSPLQAAGLQQLADALAAEGPEADSYRKYYSHHFLRRSGGPRWDTWNDAMQEYLIAEQGADPSDHTYGSWSIGGRISNNCGRLWDTVSALLRLEVYYRDSTIGENRLYPAESMPGDLDGDGDLDVSDIIIAFGNFTGPNVLPSGPFYSKTATEGDVEPAGGDGDIDVSDLIFMFSNFTGPNAPQ